MTPVVAQTTRLVGDIIMVFAAWFHSPVGIAAGLIVVLAAWSYCLLLSSKRPRSPPKRRYVAEPASTI
jgi:hypothetical protein